MKHITQEQLETLRWEREKLVGTSDFWKYDMEHSCKRDNGTWLFLGWGIPLKNCDTVVKVIKGKKYIYQGDERFTVTEAVEKLLNI